MDLNPKCGRPPSHRRQRSRLATCLPARLTTLSQCRQVILLDLSLCGARLRLPDEYELVGCAQTGVDALLRWGGFEAFGTFSWARPVPHGAEVGISFEAPIDPAALLATRHLHDSFSRQGGMQMLQRNRVRDWVEGRDRLAG